ncbi:hypothetical protein [Streptomyces sp. NRRL B-3648]|nr:hypothetical protein [Streptomyces sp. NRRL B-3648]
MYTLVVKADAVPGRHTNGRMTIGKLELAHVTGQINPSGTEN